MGERTHRTVIGRVPVYPVAFALTFVLIVFADSTAAVAALPRPLVVAGAIALGLQLLTSLVARSRDLGAFAALAILLALSGLPGLAVTLVVIPVAIIVAGVAVHRVMPAVPWRRMTEVLNGVTLLMLALTIGTTWQAGAFTLATSEHASRGSGSGPDIYLILLDGYPRADTLLDDFGFDNAPFLAEMGALGFEVAPDARSNYNLTVLTLASMLNMQHVTSIDALSAPPISPQAQYRAVTRAINDGRALDEFRARGYEIVTVPSPFSDATLYSADRLLDDRGMTDFELSLMQSGNLRHLLPDAQRALFTSALRSRVVSSLDRTVDLARERQDQPKLVLTHLMAPHDPILFGVDGSPRQGWPCFPSDCSLFDGGQRYGDAIVEPTVAQVGHLNTLVVDTARRILAESGEPPVIIVFSDHGLRHRLDDHDEMFRSLLLTYTPGQPGIVPPDATPVNLLARILNAYHGSSLVLATEESYFVDIASVRIDGILGLERVAPRAP